MEKEKSKNKNKNKNKIGISKSDDGGHIILCKKISGSRIYKAYPKSIPLKEAIEDFGGE